MAKKVKVTINLRDIFETTVTSREKRKVLRPLISSPDFHASFGVKAIETIIGRTQSGLDVNGNPFKEYSDSYAEYKGRKAPVDLTDAGDMLGNLSFRTSRESKVAIDLFFPNQIENDKAHGHINGGGNLPVRNFLGLQEKEGKTIMKAVLREIGESRATQALAEVETFDFFPGD